MSGLIGIVGAYGDVGGHATRALHRAGMELRLGGRNLAAANEFATQLDGSVECRRVDFRDPASAAEFADGCRVLLNCAGPSHAVGDVLAEAALRAGADYVDAAGDDSLHARLDNDRFTAAGRAAVLSAGVQPGLTSIFPRAIAAGLDEVTGLTVYFGLIDRFTAVAADEYLQAVADGLSTSRAAWRNGIQLGALTRRDDIRLPFVAGEITALPQLTTESVRLAESLGLQRGDWHTVLSGTHVLSVFDRVHALDRAEAIEALCRTSLLDLAGRNPLAVLAVRAEGVKDGKPAELSSVLRGPGNAPITGAVAAFAARAVARGEVPPGRHYATDVLDPVAVVAELTAPGGPAVVGAVHSIDTDEEGEL
ncbi:saccharopine dehydrogenase NADP-binding domain-containing protein [Crossiella cryophila]|uniref:Saccharopine dehydrogenase NADP binding domain-containing protein n=1 Tax=Crossiella cryophila TaxID=43355 RepID=A0A7W7CBS9_9PSEU|nr:saccharopine dehydrogenase NADP-binding domain-containing protein [Crossiella cryophila]MBB4678252.1 hypothetical protein [Crossiella cryophila]